MATNNVIEIIVKVIDAATVGINKIQASVAGLSSRVSGMMPKMTDMLKGWLLVGGITAGVGALTMGIKRMFTQTAEAERVTAQLTAAVASTGQAAGFTVKQLGEIGESLSRVTVHSTTAIGQMQALLLTFTEVRGDRFEEASKQAANLSARLGMDLTSAARLVGRALNEPAMGLYALTRSGITFSAAQREVIRNLVAAGEKAKAQDVILAELEKRIGSAALALRNTFSGALEAVKNQYQQLFQASDGALEPATKALNDLESTLHSPGLTAGLETLMVWFVKFAVVVVKAAESIGQFISGIAVLTNSTGDMAEEINNDITRLQANIKLASAELVRLNKSTLAMEWSKKEKKLVPIEKLRAEVQADIDRMRKLVDDLGKLQQDLIEGAGAGKHSAKPLGVESEDLTKAIESSRAEFEKQSEAIKDNISVLTSYIEANKNSTDAMLEARGTSRETFDAATLALERMKGKLQALNWAQFLKGFKEVGVTVKSISEGMSEAQREFLEKTETDADKTVRLLKERWFDLMLAFEKGWLGTGEEAARQFNERWLFYLDKLLPEVQNTTRKMSEPLVGLSTAGKRAIETLQGAFAAFFMNLDVGFEGLLQNILRIFQRIIAEAASVRIMKLLHIEDFIKEAEAPKRSEDRKWAEEMFRKISVGGPGQQTPQTTGAADDDSVRVTADPKAITEAVEASAKLISDSMKSSSSESAKTITGSFGGWLSKLLAVIGAGGGGGSSGGGFWSDLISGVVGAFVGSAAGGGVKGGLTRVGEEGPELAMLPGGTRVYNKRQMQFAGAAGQQLNFQPIYNITIEGNTDPATTQEMLGAMLMRRDAKIKTEVSAMLKDNGFGRMR